MPTNWSPSPAGRQGGQSGGDRRLSCRVGDDAPQAPICRSILALLDLHLAIANGETLQERFSRVHVLVAAAALAATPDVPVD